MKVTGTVKTILSERTVETASGKTIRKQDFIVEIPKPSKSGDTRIPDTIALTRCNDDIDDIDLKVGETYTFLFDSNARVSESGTGNEAFDRKTVFIIDHN